MDKKYNDFQKGILPPWASMQSWSRLGIDSINLYTTSRLISSHALSILLSKSLSDVGIDFSKFCLSTDHKFSMQFKSGDRLGHSRTLICRSRKNFFVETDVCALHCPVVKFNHLDTISQQLKPILHPIHLDIRVNPPTFLKQRQAFYPGNWCQPRSLEQMIFACVEFFVDDSWMSKV